MIDMKKIFERCSDVTWIYPASSIAQPNCCFVQKWKKFIYHLVKRHIFERKYHTVRTQKRAVLWIFQTTSTEKDA